MFKRYMHIIVFIFCFNAFCNAQEFSAPEYFAMAKKEAKNKNFEKAAVYCETALKEEPENMDYKEFLGKCYMETQRLTM
ncbi:MAG: hypothetical protein DI539_21290, partial [Flavobacterium psychrophilum]